MEAEIHEETSRRKRQSEEVRAAIDVMFEALSHIQASIDTNSEEERVQTYRKFKEALYERFEHAVGEARQERPSGSDKSDREPQAGHTGPSPTPDAAAGDGAAPANGTSPPNVSPSSNGTPSSEGAAGTESDAGGAEEASPSDSERDTLGKLWPDVAN